MTTSTKPYLIRALYEWCTDNNQTPHIVAWVNEHTRVPMQYVRENEIVLNIGPTASHNLNIGSVRSPLTPVTDTDRPIVEEAARLIRAAKEAFL